MKAESKFPIYMSQSFEQMDEAQRKEWRRELRRAGEHPGAAPYIDPSSESVYEFRPDLNATVEKSPDGRRFIVEFRDGQLCRQKPLESEWEKVLAGWAPSWMIDFGPVATTIVIAEVFLLSGLLFVLLPHFVDFLDFDKWLVGSQSVLTVGLLLHLIIDRLTRTRKKKSELELKSRDH
jgi:hypothetical protein